MKKFFKAPALLLVGLAFTAASCGGGWSDSEKKDFMDKCGKQMAEETCQCLLDKIVEKYPDAKTAEKDMTEEWVAETTLKCVTGGEEK